MITKPTIKHIFRSISGIIAGHLSWSERKQRMADFTANVETFRNHAMHGASGDQFTIDAFIDKIKTTQPDMVSHPCDVVVDDKAETITLLWGKISISIRPSNK